MACNKLILGGAIIILLLSTLVIAETSLPNNEKVTGITYKININKDKPKEVWVNSSWGEETSDNVSVSWPKKCNCTIGFNATHSLNEAVHSLVTTDGSGVIYIEGMNKIYDPIIGSIEFGITIIGRDRDSIIVDNCHGQIEVNSSDTIIKNLTIKNGGPWQHSYSVRIGDSAGSKTIENIVIDNCRFTTSAGGVHTEHTNEINITNCSFMDSVIYNGIYLHNVKGFNISNNYFKGKFRATENNKQGKLISNNESIFLNNCNDGWIYNNTIDSVATGVQLADNCSLITVSKCNISNIVISGIALWPGNPGEDYLYSGIFQHFHFGIIVKRTILKNKIINNELRNPSGLVFGILLSPQAIDNEIYKNKFIEFYSTYAPPYNRTYQAVDYNWFGPSNTWYDKEKQIGNWWYDWGGEGQDNYPPPNGDGILDNNPRPINIITWPPGKTRIQPLILPSIRKRVTKDRYPLYGIPDPIVKIIYPFGGEVFKTDKIPIRWNAVHKWLNEEYDDLLIEIKIIDYYTGNEIFHDFINNTCDEYILNVSRFKTDNNLTCYINLLVQTQTKPSTFTNSNSSPFTIYRQGPTISDIMIKDITINSTKYVSDNHKVIIEAVIGGTDLDLNNININVSNLIPEGAPPDDFYEKYTQRGMYICIINKTNCSQKNGVLDVTISATDETGTVASIGTIQADTINPTVTIKKPHGISIFGRHISFGSNRSLVIGPVLIEVKANDTELNNSQSGINRVEFYIDGTLRHSAFAEPYEWYWGETAFFRDYKIEVKAFDNAGNSCSTTEDVIRF